MAKANVPKFSLLNFLQLHYTHTIILCLPAYLN